MTNETIKRTRGRPRKFDKNEALKIALDLFRKKGFDNTSLEDLTNALHVNKPSLYAAFGNKEQLFLEALEAYSSGSTSYMFEIFTENSTKEMVRKLLTESIEILFYTEKPNGCLFVMSTTSQSLGKVGIQQKLISSLQHHQQKLVERFEQARQSGELRNDINAERLALYIATIHKGLSLQAINGTSKQELLNLVDQVIEFWPATHE